ncbi:MAG TPA: hypothetical protein VHV83_00580 [Armatimonadota bacterium]|nr:hypothetical protein [Armatimonadota bacterium]
MTTVSQRSLIVLLVILMLTLAAFAAGKEQKLAGISIGQTDNEVRGILGSPAGKIVAMPPTEVRPDDPTAAAGQTGLQSSGATTKPPNILVFTDNLSQQEVWIGDSTIVLPGATATATPAPVATDAGMSPDGTATSGNSQTVSLPVWAYTVRAGALDLNQQQYIYRINRTYSIGVTFTKKNNEYRVTDIVASSFEPLTKYPNKPGERAKAFNFGNRTPMTSEQVQIGSSFALVLEKYGWPQYCYPYVSKPISEIKGDISKSIPVPFYSVTGSDSGLTVTPQPNIWDTQQTIPGDSPMRFTDGKKEVIRVGFSRNCFVIYPNAGVAFTLADMDVVRIQIGNGVVTPPPPPKPSTQPTAIQGGAMPGGAPVPGGGMIPQPGFGVPQVQPGQDKNPWAL